MNNRIKTSHAIRSWNSEPQRTWRNIEYFQRAFGLCTLAVVNVKLLSCPVQESTRLSKWCQITVSHQIPLANTSKKTSWCSLHHPHHLWVERLKRILQTGACAKDTGQKDHYFECSNWRLTEMHGSYLLGRKEGIGDYDKYFLNAWTVKYKKHTSHTLCGTKC